MRAKSVRILGGAAAVGVGLLLAAHWALARGPRDRGPRFVAGPIRDLQVPIPGHAQLDLSRENLAIGRGLKVAGVLRIGNAKPAKGRRIPLEVVACVIERPTREIVVPEMVLGAGADVPGKGAWEQEFTLSCALPPGRYAVDMTCRVPDTLVEHPDGSVSPSVFCKERRSYVVK